MARLVWLVGLLALALAAGAQTRDRSLVVTPQQQVAGEARHALVVGNGAYLNGPLRNPVNDARAMAKALGEAGFTVHLLEDASQAAMQRAIRTFGNQIAKGGVGLFYYAGHGLQARGRNYLVPVNAEIAQEDEIEFGSVDVNLVLAKMDSAKNALNIVILDACRNNPFARAFRSMQTGLAQMDAPTGTFIAFATAPGSVAADGTGANGIYTKHLLAEMSRPGLPIEQLFKQVRIGVMQDTGGQQIPWESSSLRGEFAFRTGAQPGVTEAVAEALKRERETQRLEMEKILAAALERQRKELAAAGLQSAAAAKPAPVPTAPPVTTASVAAVPATPSRPAKRMPQAGDTWTYRLTEPKREQRNYVVTVATSTDTAILEKYAIDGVVGEWVHSSGGYLVGLGKALFAPYMAVFRDLTPSQALGSVQISDPACSGHYRCQASARVAGRETLKTAAGTFDVIRVEVEQDWQPTVAWGASAQFSGARVLTVWYAPAAKRAVKFSSRASFGFVPPIDTDFDLELVSHQVK